MNKAEWRKVVRQCAESAGTYRPFFDPVIDTLSDILEKRDTAQRQFDESGGAVVVEHTNKGGNTNIEQNPLLRLLNDLNRDALAYWRDLGLTPAGLKRINEKLMQKPKRNALAEALKDIGG